MSNLHADYVIDNLNADAFDRIQGKSLDAEEILRPATTYWQDSWRRFKGNKLALLSLLFIIIASISAFLVPILSKYDIATVDFSIMNLSPNAEHWFGTDFYGRDIFVRVLYGMRISLVIAFAATILNLVIGVLYGAIAGFAGGRIDALMMRFVDILYSVPMQIYVILIMVAMGDNKAGILPIVIALGVASWLSMARIVRGETMQLKESEFVLAAKTLGATNQRILFKHLLPNAMSSIIVTATLLIPSAIFTESFLSYIGIGISPPEASLGTLVSEAMQIYQQQPYQLIIPALAISLIIFAFNLLGDGLRDALDPKMSR
ncbi:ABC transporter permease [Proteiniclasticum sp. QWL-01]|uniref:ABC transporter permease n=1 Tax=Proteiniclasticum sp. QWL-01 TaxID=3036945 RepID=UPI0022054B85|nr:ABC transporter permease [Proteiniclasticum sp. QWL-01]UUM11870.1 ABC transporter permease [Clostridiaceae bacterium HFYG-1003]WFF73361.1 ABC transporter permease [Proteiniclasticum sp. QWL-01]